MILVPHTPTSPPPSSHAMTVGKVRDCFPKPSSLSSLCAARKWPGEDATVSFTLLVFRSLVVVHPVLDDGQVLADVR